MAQLIGQIFNPSLHLKDKEGKQIQFTAENWEEKLQSAEKAVFSASIGTRRAYKSDNENEKFNFTEVVAHGNAQQTKGLVKVLYNNFGQPEHKGKPVVLYGHFNERTWTPDVNKRDHQQNPAYCKKETLFREDLEALGMVFAEGSKDKVSFYVAIPQTVKQLVVNNFEFIDGAFNNSSESNTSAKTTSGRKSNVAFVADDEDEPVLADGEKEETPF